MIRKQHNPRINPSTPSGGWPIGKRNATIELPGESMIIPLGRQSRKNHRLAVCAIWTACVAVFLVATPGCTYQAAALATIGAVRAVKNASDTWPAPDVYGQSATRPSYSTVANSSSNANIASVGKCRATDTLGFGSQSVGAFPGCCSTTSDEDRMIAFAFAQLNDHRTANGRPLLMFDHDLQLAANARVHEVGKPFHMPKPNSYPPSTIPECVA